MRLVASPRGLGLGVTSSRISTFWGPLTTFLGGVGIRTHPVTADIIYPQLWGSPVYYLSRRKHHVEGRNYGYLVPSASHTYAENSHWHLPPFSHFSSHGDELSLNISLCDYLFRVYLSLVLGTNGGLDHS